MKNKKLLIAIIALVVVIGVLLGVFFATRKDPNEGKKAYTVTVVHSDGNEKVFEGYSDAEYLGTVLVEAGIVEDNQSDYGLYILVAGNQEISAGVTVTAQSAAAGTQVPPGTTIRLEFADTRAAD